jgi:O-antigen/teichoic acid export membrane protein
MFVIYAQPDHPKMFGQFFMLYSLLLVYAALTLSMLSPEIVHMMVGPQFASSQEVIPIVCLAYVFYGIGYFTQVGMFVLNKTSLIGIIGVVTAILNLALNYFLILFYGMLGAAWATLVSFLAMAMGSYWVSNRLYPLPLRVGQVLRALMMGAGFYLFSLWASPRSFALAVPMKAFLLVLFPIFLWKTGLLSQGEIGTLLSTRDNALAGASRFFKRISRKTACV